MAVNDTQNASQSSHSAVESILEQFKSEILPQHGTKILIAVLVVVAVIIGVIQHRKNSQVQELAYAETLGQGYVHLYNGRTDSALSVLEPAIHDGVFKGLALAKASLLTANIHLQQGELDKADELYQKALDNAGSVILVASGALHGKAVVAMERKDYAAAATLLEKFIDQYGKRTGNLSDRYAQKEAADPITTIPDALWKLVLCQQELGQTDKARATAQKLIKIYGESRQAGMARKYLAL